jgi:hypothetical protein
VQNREAKKYEKLLQIDTESSKATDQDESSAEHLGCTDSCVPAGGWEHHCSAVSLLDLLGALSLNLPGVLTEHGGARCLREVGNWAEEAAGR